MDLKRSGDRLSEATILVLIGNTRGAAPRSFRQPRILVDAFPPAAVMSIGYNVVCSAFS